MGGRGWPGGSLTAGNPSQVHLKRCGESVGTERRRGEGVLPLPLLLLSAATAAAAEPKRSRVIRSRFHNCKVQQNSHAVKQNKTRENTQKSQRVKF